MAFCSAALLGPGGSALGLMGLPLGMQREGPTLSTPSSAGGTMATMAAEATGLGGCCCSTASVIKPWLRIRALKRQRWRAWVRRTFFIKFYGFGGFFYYLTGLSGIFPSFIPPVEAVREGAVGAKGGREGVVVEEADIVTTVVAEAVAELNEGRVTSWASEASSPQWGQKSIPPPFALLRPPPSTVTQPRWKRWAMRWSGQHSRNVPWKRLKIWMRRK